MSIRTIFRVFFGLLFCGLDEGFSHNHKNPPHPDEKTFYCLLPDYGEYFLQDLLDEVGEVMQELPEHLLSAHISATPEGHAVSP